MTGAGVIAVLYFSLRRYIKTPKVAAVLQLAVLIKKAVIATQRARINHNCFASENDPAFAGSCFLDTS